jgi:hypothetical protein
MKRSWYVYLLIFVLSLPCFLWLRWQPEPLVYSTLNRLKINKVIHVGSISKHWLPGLRLSAVKIKLRKGPEIQLDSLDVTPVWWHLLLGRPAIALKGTGRKQTFSMVVALSGGNLIFSDLDLNADIKILKPYIPQIASLPLLGTIQLQGEVGLNRKTMQPWKADLKLAVNQVELMSRSGKRRLGDYLLTLVSDNRQWNWVANGGETILLDAKGRLKPNVADMTRWILEGEVTISGKGESAKLLEGILGKNPAQATISGNLRNPVFHWQS